MSFSLYKVMIIYNKNSSCGQKKDYAVRNKRFSDNTVEHCIYMTYFTA